MRKLIAEHGAALARHLTRVGTPTSEIDDVAQQAFVVAAGKLHEVPEGEERAFLFGVGMRLARNARRGLSRRLRAWDRLSLLTDDSPSHEELEDSRRARARIQEALLDMPADLRTVFIACDLEDTPMAELALELGVPEGTVASRLRRARERVREWLVSATERHDPRRLVVPEVYSWWVSRGEVDALEALLSVYRRSFPQAAVVHTAMRGSGLARRDLEMRMAGGAPPDTFQANGGRDLLSWLRRPNKLAALDSLVDTETWRSAFHPDVLSLVSEGGHLYGVPVDVHRLNTMFYDKRLFAELGLGLPHTLNELHEVAGEVARAGFRPFALGLLQPWALTLLAFENILVAVGGISYYRAFLAGQRRPEDDEIRETLDHVARIVGQANDDALTLTWDQAVGRIGEGAGKKRCAMTIMGDWASGYLARHDRLHAVGQVPCPGTEGAFVFASDVFALPAAAAHRKSALRLLSIFASRDGQGAFNDLKGSLPARADTELHDVDSNRRTTLADFGAQERVHSLSSIAPSHFVRALDAAMGVFARDRDPAAVIAALRSHYSLLGR